MALPQNLSALIQSPARSDADISIWTKWFYKEFIPQLLGTFFSSGTKEDWLFKQAKSENKDPIVLANEYIDQLYNALKENLIELPKIQEALQLGFDKLKEILKSVEIMLTKSNATDGLSIEIKVPGEIFQLALDIGTRAHYPGESFGGDTFESKRTYFENRPKHPWCKDVEERLLAMDETNCHEKIQAIATYSKRDDKIDPIPVLIQQGLITQSEVDFTKSHFENSAKEFFQKIQPYLYYILQCLPKDISKVHSEVIIIKFVQNQLLEQYRKGFKDQEETAHLPLPNVELENAVKQLVLGGLGSDHYLKSLYNEPEYKIKVYFYEKFATGKFAKNELIGGNLERFFDDGISAPKAKTCSDPKLYYPISEEAYKELINIFLALYNEIIENFDINEEESLETEGSKTNGTLSFAETSRPSNEFDEMLALKFEKLTVFNQWCERYYLVLYNFIKPLINFLVNDLISHIKDDFEKETIRIELAAAYFQEFGMLVSFILEKAYKENAFIKARSPDLNNFLKSMAISYCGRAIGRRLHELYLLNERRKWLNLLSKKQDDIEKAPVKLFGLDIESPSIPRLSLYRALEKEWNKGSLSIETELNFLSLIVPIEQIDDALIHVVVPEKPPSSSSLKELAVGIEKAAEAYIKEIYKAFYQYEKDDLFYIHSCIHKILAKPEKYNNLIFYNETEPRVRKIYTTEALKKKFPELSKDKILDIFNRAEKDFENEYKSKDEKERNLLLAELNKFAKLGGLEIEEITGEIGKYAVKGLDGDYSKRSEVQELTLKIASLIVGEHGYYSHKRLYGEKPRYGLSKKEKRALYVEIRNAVYKDEAQTKIRRHRYPFFALRKYIAQPILNTLRNIANILISPFLQFSHHEHPVGVMAPPIIADGIPDNAGSPATSFHSDATTPTSSTAVSSAEEIIVDCEQPTTAVAFDTLLLKTIPTTLNVSPKWTPPPPPHLPKAASLA